MLWVCALNNFMLPVMVCGLSGHVPRCIRYLFCSCRGTRAYLQEVWYSSWFVMCWAEWSCAEKIELMIRDICRRTHPNNSLVTVNLLLGCELLQLRLGNHTKQCGCFCKYNYPCGWNPGVVLAQMLLQRGWGRKVIAYRSLRSCIAVPWVMVFWFCFDG